MEPLNANVLPVKRISYIIALIYIALFPCFIKADDSKGFPIRDPISSKKYEGVGQPGVSSVSIIFDDKGRLLVPQGSDKSLILIWQDAQKKWIGTEEHGITLEAEGLYFGPLLRLNLVASNGTEKNAATYYLAETVPSK